MPETQNKTEEPIIFAPKTYQYDKDSLDIDQVDKDPIVQFTKWFKELSETTNELLPECVNFATLELPSGKVSSRVVLFKELDHRGFVVYSNWESKKGLQIKSNPNAAMTFFWKVLQRQVRVEGFTEFVSRETSQRYFNTRPRGSQIGAWSSPQSSEIQSREEFESIYKKREEEFKDLKEIPCPDYWGGLRIVPLEIEFWQGRPSRLHDRIVYRRDSETDDWKIIRIAP